MNHSETAVPIQWSFRQWANQSSAVKDRFGKVDKPKKKHHNPFGHHGHGHKDKHDKDSPAASDTEGHGGKGK